MGNPTIEQASSSSGRWQTWKWAVYTSACYALHVILVSMHAILLVLHKYRSEKTVTIPPNTTAIVGVVVILQTFGIVYGILLVWLTQQLALRRDLLRDQMLTAIHDKARAWGGLGAALNTFVDQFKVKADRRGVVLVTLYLGGIFVLHLTSASLMSLFYADDGVHLQLVINVTPVAVGLFNSVLLLALSSFLIRTPSAGNPQTVHLSSCGVLQVVWLASHHTEIQEVVKTKTPETSELRRIGLHVTTTFGEVPEPTKGSNTP